MYQSTFPMYQSIFPMYQSTFSISQSTFSILQSTCQYSNRRRPCSSRSNQIQSTSGGGVYSQRFGAEATRRLEYCAARVSNIPIERARMEQSSNRPIVQYINRRKIQSTVSPIDEKSNRRIDGKNPIYQSTKRNPHINRRMIQSTTRAIDAPGHA